MTGLIDTHLHLIVRDWAGYSWTDDELVLHGDFTLEMAEELQGDRVIGRVFMEAGADDADYRREARVVGGLVESGRLLGQIASCRPEEDGISEWLDEAEELGVVGYRRILHVVPDAMSQSALFRANVAEIGRRGRTFDLCFRTPQLPVAVELIRALPEVQFILDHFGTPDIVGNDHAEWAPAIAAVAACDNVVVKLSGITAYCGGQNADFRPMIAPYVDHVLDVFGPSRMVWGSDWPVADLGAGMRGWLDITGEILARVSADEAAAIGAGNALRVYGLKG